MAPLKYWKAGFFLMALLIALFLADVLVGSIHIPFNELLSILKGNTTTFSDIIIQFRLPKAITCVLAGGALATGGLLMQTLFRNPLAGPDVLGLTSGASLMVAVMILVSQSNTVLNQLVFNNPWSTALGASMGGGIIFILIISIAQYVKDNTSLLIIGLMISAVASSLVSVLQFISKAEDLQTYLIWTLGTVGSTSWNEINVFAIVVICGLAIGYASIKS